MDGAGPRIASGVRAGVAFTSEAWRDAWAPLLVVASGQALTFVGGHAGFPTALANQLQLGGWGLSALALAPALGALYRSAVGGSRPAEIRLAGLQFGGAEQRLLLIALAGGVCTFLALVGTGVAALVARMALGGAGVVRLPVLGPFALWFVAAAPILVVLVGAAYAFLARLSLALPAAVAEGRVNLARALRFSRRWKASLVAALVLTELLPAAVVFGVARALEMLERGWAQSAGVSAWPLLDASVAGVVLAFATAFVVLPMGVGARTAFYARALAEERAAARRRAPFEEPAPKPTEVAKPEADAEIEAESNAVELVPEPPPIPTQEEAMAALQAKLEEAAERVEAAGGARVYADGWRPPVAPLRAADLAQSIAAPVLLTPANDRAPDPRWWSPPEHPHEPPVA